MAHQVVIAKATFAATLFKPDPTSIPRDEANRFHELLNTETLKCTPQNVQQCKRWILTHIAHSTNRVTALGRYLIALSSNFQDDANPSVKAVKAKRKRLHILYLIHDTISHAKKLDDPVFFSAISPVLPGLFSSAASFPKCPKHIAKLEKLLSIWDKRTLVSPSLIRELRKVVEDAKSGATPSKEDKEGQDKKAKEPPYIMPQHHGDADTKWYDLPAGNLMLCIQPNSTKPINPSMVKPLQFNPGPAELEVIEAVKGLLSDAKAIYGESTDGDSTPAEAEYDIDELGQHIVRDKASRKQVIEETYYGWSERFCTNMKRKLNGDVPESRSPSRSRSRSRSRSYSRSRSRSFTPRSRRRRYSSSDRSMSRSRSRSRTGRNRDLRSESRSRSRSMSRRRRMVDSRERERPRYSRSPSPLRPGLRGGDPPPPSSGSAALRGAAPQDDSSAEGMRIPGLNLLHR